MKTLEEAKIIARSSDPGWLGEELFRLQGRLQGLAIEADGLRKRVAEFDTQLFEAVELARKSNEISAVRIAELERGPDWAEFRRIRQLADAAAKANEALERIGEQARQRIVELTAGLREACDVAESTGPKHDQLGRLRKLVERAEAETPADNLEAKYQRFAALRDELVAAGVCLACGAHKPGQSCQCENDE